MARKHSNQAPVIEAVESRLMMSASVAPVHAATVKPADPALYGKDITYKNFATNPLFGPMGPSVNDVSQGELGDCYLLSSLSSIAKIDPRLIEKDVVANGNGTFNVTFGNSKPIQVNADLPTVHGGQLAYAQFGADGSIWVAIVEKAYADFRNPKADSYATLNGGWMGDVFNAFGLASESVNATSASSLMTTLGNDLKADDFTTIGTKDKLPKGSPLVADHAYDVDTVHYDSKGNAVSVTLRNPWGNDVADGGYVTITAAQAFAAIEGGAIAHA